MTLVALTVNYGFPVLMADILITSTEVKNAIALPTDLNGSPKATSGQGRQPLRLNQKLYIINDRLCVGMGGRVTQMERLLKKLQAFFGDVSFDDQQLEDFLRHYPEEDRSSLFAIVLTWKQIEGEYNFRVLWLGKWHILENDRYEKVYAGGSGSSQFIDFIRTNPIFGSDLEGADNALVLNQSLLGYWLLQEVANGESVANHWGAGYEMITFNGTRFVKLNEYTVIMLAGKFGKDIPFNPYPFSTMMVTYHKDAMVIKVLLHDTEATFVVPSILSSADLDTVISDFVPQHTSLFIGFIITDVDTNTEYTPVVVRPRNINEFGKSPVVFEHTGKKLRVGMDPREAKFILDQILQMKNLKKT